MTLQEIDEMAIIEPYCFENEQEEQWYKVGLREGADAAIKQLGWHPASEHPVIPEGKFSVRVIAYCSTPSGIYAPVEITYTRTRGWQYESVKWWCYLPKEK